MDTLLVIRINLALQQQQQQLINNNSKVKGRQDKNQITTLRSSSSPGSTFGGKPGQAREHNIKASLMINWLLCALGEFWSGNSVCGHVWGLSRRRRRRRRTQEYKSAMWKSFFASVFGNCTVIDLITINNILCVCCDCECDFNSTYRNILVLNFY